MPVYIDDFNAEYGRLKMCHMRADTLEELHEMADKLGLKRSWFQNHHNHPHYDICLSKKKQAIKLGAKAMKTMEMARYFLNQKLKTNI